MFFSLVFFLTLNSITLLFIEINGKGKIAKLFAKPLQGGIAGMLLFIHLICHGWAISMTKAVYMISIKRMSILFGVIYGGIYFAISELAGG